MKAVHAASTELIMQNHYTLEYAARFRFRADLVHFCSQMISGRRCGIRCK